MHSVCRGCNFLIGLTDQNCAAATDFKLEFDRDPQLALRALRAGRQPSSLWVRLHWPCCARSDTVQQELAFACIACKRCGALELRLRLREATQFAKEIAANAGQEVVARESCFRGELLDELEARCWTEGHGHRDRAIQLHDG